MQAESEAGTTIRRPQAGDLTERPVVAAVREAREFIADTTGEAARAGLKVTRTMLICFLLSALAVPAVIALLSPLRSGVLKLICLYMAVIAVALLAWSSGLRSEWLGRQRRRRERICELEETDELRKHALGSLATHQYD